jgi:hypothetical protein
MANQKAIDRFLKDYDNGVEITPEILKKLVEGLRSTKRGRPKKPFTDTVTLAIYQLLTAKEIARLINKDEKTVRDNLARAKKEGWVNYDARNYVDKKGKFVPHPKWCLTSESREIWLDNGSETWSFTFSIEKNKLFVSSKYLF